MSNPAAEHLKLRVLDPLHEQVARNLHFINGILNGDTRLQVSPFLQPFRNSLLHALIVVMVVGVLVHAFRQHDGLVLFLFFRYADEIGAFTHAKTDKTQHIIEDAHDDDDAVANQYEPSVIEDGDW